MAYGVRCAIVFIGYTALALIQHMATTSEPNIVLRCFTYGLFAFMVVTSIKRLHDIGYGAVAVIFLGPIIPLLLFAPGERRPNAYGDPPPAFGRGTGALRQRE
jgi:uncharacterized membrane protein YhaH (DUF805 family)